MSIRVFVAHYGFSFVCIFLFAAAIPTHSQGTFVYDQQSATNGFGANGSHIQSSQPVAQSFTPTASLIGFATFQFSDTVLNNGIGSSVFVNLRENSVTGSVVAATSPVSMPDNFGGNATFLFPANIPITSGNSYLLELVLQSGDDTSVLADFFNYPGGTAFIKGVPNSPGMDFWFREGYIVPEPSVTALAFLGILAFVRRRRSVNNP